MLFCIWNNAKKKYILLKYIECFNVKFILFKSIKYEESCIMLVYFASFQKSKKITLSDPLCM